MVKIHDIDVTDTYFQHLISNFLRPKNRVACTRTIYILLGVHNNNKNYRQPKEKHFHDIIQEKGEEI